MNATETASTPLPRIVLTAPRQRPAHDDHRPMHEDSPGSHNWGPQNGALFPGAVPSPHSVRRPLPPIILSSGDTEPALLAHDEQILDLHRLPRALLDQEEQIRDAHRLLRALLAHEEHMLDAHRPQWRVDRERDAAHPLLSRDAMVYAPQPETWTSSLMLTARFGLEWEAFLLMMYGATVNAFNIATLNDALIAAVVHGQAGMTNILLHANAAVDTLQPGTLDSLLTITAEQGNIDVMQVLLNEHAAVDAPHPVTGSTALMIAIEVEKWDAVHVLLAGGADVNFPNPLTGDTARMLAEQLGHSVALQTVLDTLARVDVPHPVTGNTALMGAIVEEEWDKVQVLLDGGADVNFPNPLTGDNALMLAQLRGHTAQLSALLTRGAVEDAAPPGNAGNASAPVHFATIAHDVTSLLPGATDSNGVDGADTGPMAAEIAIGSDARQPVMPDALVTSEDPYGAAFEENNVWTGVRPAMSAGPAPFLALLAGYVGLGAEWDGKDPLFPGFQPW